MNILHVIESSGGSADFVLYLIKYLPEHHHQVIYGNRTFGKNLEKVKAAYPNTSFYYWKGVQREINLIEDTRAAINLFLILRKLYPDVIHLHSSKAGFLGRFICFLLRRKNVIYTPNGLAFLRTDVSALKILIFIWLEKFASKLNGRIISCSQSEANALIGKGIPSSYISNGTEIFDSKKTESNTNSLTIVTTGRVTIQKNPALFQTIASHFENNPIYKFIWIGSGELEHLLVSKNITITGWLDKHSVFTKVLDADIYISTALWEGLPFAVLEAMNLAKPLLLSSCVGNIDLVKDGCNGFLFNSSTEAINRILSICDDKNKLTSLGAESKRMAAEHFDVKIMAKEYEQAYIFCLQR